MNTNLVNEITASQLKKDKFIFAYKKSSFEPFKGEHL